MAKRAKSSKATQRANKKASRGGSRTLKLDGERLGRSSLDAIARGEVKLELASSAKKKVRAARRLVDEIVEEERTAYGINTGFGRFCNVRISTDQVRELQRNLIRSHGCGVGEPLSPEIVRLALAFRANTLARGNSGIRLEVMELLLDLYNHDVLPWVPSQGSVGASGDLAPLAHLAQPLIGEGKAYVGGRLVSGRKALEKHGLEPVELLAKEGLALINGVQITCAILSDALLRAERLSDAADAAAAVSVDALLGSASPFDARIHDARPHPGQRRVAASLRALLKGSAILKSHRDCGRVQDAYSLRCVPQVHGAVRDTLEYVWSVLEREINSSTDNPLLFVEEGEVVSGGNFHGAPVGYVADLLSIAVTDLASISERRIERLVNPDLSGHPAFLAQREGLDSGYMMAQVTAAALVSECKTLAHPASVDTIPTSASTEDHVSMSTHAARQAREIVGNAERVLGIEWLVATTAIERLAPLRTGAKLRGWLGRFRSAIPVRLEDRDLSGEIERAAEWIREGA